MSEIRWLPLLAVLLVASAAMPILVAMLHRSGQADQPNNRSLHIHPTPRGAGLALLIGLLVGFALLTEVPWYFWLGAAGFTAVGALDDQRDVRAVPKLLLQVMFVVPITLGVRQQFEGLGLIALPVAFLLLATVNAVNFMDGINGITGLHAALWGIVYAVAFDLMEEPLLVNVALMIAVLGLAFLPWNAIRAKIFLGDSGSYLIGVMVGLLAAMGVLSGQPIAFLAPLTIYAFDTGFTLLRRLRNDKSLTEAHREHVFQRLTLAGKGHLSIAVITAAFTVCTSILGLLSIGASTVIAMLLLGAIVVVGLTYLSLPKLLSSTGHTTGQIN